MHQVIPRVRPGPPRQGAQHLSFLRVLQASGDAGGAENPHHEPVLLDQLMSAFL
jgi:hypothetical protein